MAKYAIGLGSNLGDRFGIMRQAVDSLGELGELLAVSSLYETAPIGGPSQGPYLNAVVLIDTELGLDELMRSLFVIERSAGRERDVRWGPRLLDLDILCGEQRKESTRLVTLPHPRAAQRRFVLEPLIEVWPEAHIGCTPAKELIDATLDQEVDRLTVDWLGADPG